MNKDIHRNKIVKSLASLLFIVTKRLIYLLFVNNFLRYIVVSSENNVYLSV